MNQVNQHHFDDLNRVSKTDFVMKKSRLYKKAMIGGVRGLPGSISIAQIETSAETYWSIMVFPHTSPEVVSRTSFSDHEYDEYRVYYWSQVKAIVKAVATEGVSYEVVDKVAYV